MNRSVLKKLFGAMSACLLITVTANAGLITQGIVSAGNPLGDNVLGQSFIADENTLVGVDLMLYNTSGNTSLLTVDILSGDGVNGQVIGSSGPVSVAAHYLYATNGWFGVSFNNVNLNVGSSYTFKVSSSQSTNLYWSYNNPYANGSAYAIYQGTPQNGYQSIDLAFRTHTATTSVPEPSSIALFCSGILMLSGIALRRGQKSTLKQRQ